MFKSTVDKNQLQALLRNMSAADEARFFYCVEMSGTFIAVGKFEHMLISAMHMCDRVKVKNALGDDDSWWRRSLEKRAILEGSTLGSLIKILERNGISPSDLSYLRWIKDKRDYFVHRLFHEGLWPGDLNEDGCQQMRRRLLALQAWLERGERNIWAIFERAGFVEVDRLEDGGIIVMNSGIFDIFDANVAYSKPQGG